MVLCTRPNGRRTRVLCQKHDTFYDFLYIYNTFSEIKIEREEAKAITLITHTKRSDNFIARQLHNIVSVSTVFNRSGTSPHAFAQITFDLYDPKLTLLIIYDF